MTVTVIFPPPSSTTEAPLNVIPLTLVTVVVPSPTLSGLPPPPVVNPVIVTTPPSALFKFNVPKPEL